MVKNGCGSGAKVMPFIDLSLIIRIDIKMLRLCMLYIYKHVKTITIKEVHNVMGCRRVKEIE